MKRTRTADPNIVIYQSGMHYFRRGSKEISLKTLDYKEAVKRKRIVEASGDDILRSSLSLRIKDVLQEYKDDREAEFKKGEIRESTIIHTKKFLAPISVRLGRVPVARMDSVVWETFKKRIKGNQIVNIRNVMSHFMKWSIKKGYRSTLPYFPIKKIVRRKRRILEPHEIDAIWSNSSGSLRIFIALALGLGMRRSEIMTLEWGQVNFNKRAIFLPASKTKTKRDRWVTMPVAVVEILKGRRALTKGLWVFPHLYDRKIHADKSGLKTAWKTCLRRAFNIVATEVPNITWHDLRATCEFYAHKRTDISATQLEKFFGASVDVQRKIYVQGDMEFVRGVESSTLIPRNSSGENMGRANDK